MKDKYNDSFLNESGANDTTGALSLGNLLFPDEQTRKRRRVRPCATEGAFIATTFTGWQNIVWQGTSCMSENLSITGRHWPDCHVLDLKADRVSSYFQQHNYRIGTMAPEPIEVIRDFPITVQWQEDEFRADFIDANLSAFGTTQSEAIWNLKDLIAITFDTLSRHEKERLGRGPARQLAVLRSYLRSHL